MIYSKTPIEVMFDIVKDTGLQIYKFSMNEDENSTPASYLLLRPQVSDSPNLFGDGETKIRRADCDFILVTKGWNKRAESTHNKNAQIVVNALNAAGLPFIVTYSGYNTTAKATEQTFSVEVFYYG